MAKEEWLGVIGLDEHKKAALQKLHTCSRPPLIWRC